LVWPKPAQQPALKTMLIQDAIFTMSACGCGLDHGGMGFVQEEKSNTPITHTAKYEQE
jgi:hypothetical protein